MAVVAGAVALAGSCGEGGDEHGVGVKQRPSAVTTTPVVTGGTTGAVEMVEGRFSVRIDGNVRRAASAAGLDLDRIVEQALTRVDDLLPGRRADIRIAADRARVIPEVGAGGFTDPRSGTVSVWLDVTNGESFAEAVTVWLPETLAHELHHQRRLAHRPGPWATLAEAFVTEGLATVFAREAFPSTPLQPWARALDPRQEHDLWRTASPVLEQPHTQHERWFFGRGDLPGWAGYTLGVRVVESFINRHPGQTAAALVGEPATHIIAGARYEP